MPRRSFQLLIAIAVTVLSLFAQVETSTSIRGLATDVTGAVVPGASVKIRNVETGVERSTTTGGGGAYSFPSVAPGTYDIVVTHQGFKRSEVKNRVAQVTSAAQVDFVLQVGETSESVTVSAEGTELIVTSTAEVASTINQELIANLPLNGRNFFDLAMLSPNITPQNLGTQITFASFSQNVALGTSSANPIFRQSGIIAAGNRDSAANISVDGVNVQSSVYGQTSPQQPPSTIQEVKVHIAAMNPEFGNGAAAVNVITKSGTNQLHGELYEFLRNDKLDANYFFSNLAARDKPPYRQNQFGGAIGGPVIKNKLFFFGGYEGLRVRRTSVGFQAVPTDDLRQGNFSTYRTPLGNRQFGSTPIISDPLKVDPATGLRVPFPDNRIPVSRFDPVTAKFLNDWVARPNGEIDLIPNIIGTATAMIDMDQYTARGDWDQSERTRIYGRYSLSNTPSLNASLQSLQGDSNNSVAQNAVLHWTQLVSTSIVNDLFVGYSRPKWLYGKRQDIPDVAALIGLKNTSTIAGSPNFAVPNFNMNNSSSFILGSIDNIFQFGDDVSIMRGRHNLKLGFSGLARRFYYDRYSNDKGYFRFNPTYTRACPPSMGPTCNGKVADAGGLGFADFLLGFNDYAQFELATVYVGHRDYAGAYVQDSWRVTPKLTLNYGLRYEYWSPWRVPRNITVSWDETNGDILYALQNPLDYLDPAKNFGKSAPLNPKIPREGYSLSKKNFAPRLGLAYNITSGTVFRAAYGIFYDGNVNGNQFSNIQTGIAPFFLRLELPTAGNEMTPPLKVAGSFPYAGPTTIPFPNANPQFSFRFVKQDQKVSAVQEWSASVQRRLSTDWMTELNYTGTHVTNQMQFIDDNAPELPQGALANVSLQQRRRFPQWGVVSTWAPIGSGKYHAGSATLRNNSWKGLSSLTSFTWAKNLVTSMVGTSDIGNSHYKYYDIWRGPAQLTPRLRFVNAYSYDLPFGKGKQFGSALKGLGGVVASGWRLSGNLDFTTGVPNFVQTNDTSGVALNVAMPDRLCDARDVPGGRDRFAWFNKGCFVNPSFGHFGSSHLGVYEDPGIANWNLGVEKSTRVGPGERGLLELRFEFFNVLNHTQWGQAVNITTQAGYSNSGSISSTRPPRQIQLGAQYRF